MAIPIRNTTRQAAVKSAYGLSFYSTPSGAVIEGSTRQYATYKAMVTDAAPTRLGAVLNASMDTDYPVPAEHKGGILYQYDSVNSTWVLLYTVEDMTVPTRINWPNILNVPKWVGGITNNRVKLTANRFAETRTTYYSFGDYILVLPDPNTVGLGDQIALEQYDGQGAICYPYIASEASQYLENISNDSSIVISFTMEYNGESHEFTLWDIAASGTDRVWYHSRGDNAYDIFKFDTVNGRWAYVENCTIDGVALDDPYCTWCISENTADPWSDTVYVLPEDNTGEENYSFEFESTRCDFNDSIDMYGYVFTPTETQSDDLYHVEYTNADYAYTLDNSGHMVIDATKPTNHHTYVYTCTETSLGERIWRLNADEDLSESLIDIRKEMIKHQMTYDPHHQYILKAEVGTYISSLIEVKYTLPDAETFRKGGLYLATVDDVISAVPGARAVNPSVLNTLLSSYATASHNHTLDSLANVDASVISDGQVLMYNGVTGIWEPHLVSGSVVYTDATTTQRGLAYIATSDAWTQGADGARFINPALLSSILSSYVTTSDLNIGNIDGLNIGAAQTGNVIVASNGAFYEAPMPAATTTFAGAIQIASASDIASGTTVDNKAVTPQQLITVSGNIINQVIEMMYNSGYVLPSATSTNLGGVRLVNDAVLSLIVNDFPEFSSHSVASATVINPMQFASYHCTLSSSVSSAASSMCHAVSAALSNSINTVRNTIGNVEVIANNASTIASATSSSVNSRVDALSSSITGINWYSGSDVTQSAMRTSSGSVAYFQVPKNGFIRFQSIPNTDDALFSAALGPKGKFAATGYVMGSIAGETAVAVHRAHGRIGDSNNEGDYYNLNIDMVPVNKNDVVYLEVLGYHYVDSAYTTSSYLNFGGFTVTYFPAN